MTTESHLSHTIAPRRTYLIGRARPNAIIGRNRETGEIALIVAGAFLGMMCGLLVPTLSLRIVLLMGFPMLALAAVYVPYRVKVAGLGMPNGRLTYKIVPASYTNATTFTATGPTGQLSTIDDDLYMAFALYESSSQRYIDDTTSGNFMPKGEPIAVTADNIKDTVISDGFYTIEEICTDQYADTELCKGAGS